MTAATTIESITPTKEQVEVAVEAILQVLGSPENSAQAEALEAFKSGNYSVCKRIAATNLSDQFCKALGYLPGAYKLTPNTDTILAEAARSAAEASKEKTLRRLGEAIAKAFS